MAWTPAIGSKALVTRLGERRALELLATLLSGKVAGPDLLASPFSEALLDIGDGHANQLMADPSGKRLAYWPRVWAARALAYVGNESVAPVLLNAIDDHHWRVRMTAIRTVGRLGIKNATSQIVARLDDEHSRVRATVLLALERVGTEEALAALSQKFSGSAESRSTVERAMVAITERTEAE